MHSFIKKEFSTRVVLLDDPVDSSPVEVTKIVQPWEISVSKTDGMDIPFFENDNFRLIKKAIQSGEHVWVFGGAGTSKSRPIAEAVKQLGMGFYRINMNGHSTDEALIGAPRIKADKETSQSVMYWNKGILEKAMTHGLDAEGNVVGEPAVLLIDEISGTPPETLFVLHRVLEPEKTLMIDNDGGRVVKAHPRFQVVAADNTLGTGDILGGYAGTNTVNFALRDRFGLMVEVTYDEKLERQILEHLLEATKFKSNIPKMQSLAKKIRKANDNGDISFPMSLRRIISWAKSTILFGEMSKGFKVSVMHYLEHDQRNVVSEMYQRTIGVSIG